MNTNTILVEEVSAHLNLTVRPKMSPSHNEFAKSKFQEAFRDDLEKAIAVLNREQDIMGLDDALYILQTVQNGIDFIYGQKPVMVPEDTSFRKKQVVRDFTHGIESELHRLFMESRYGLEGMGYWDETVDFPLTREFAFPLTQVGELYETVRNLQDIRSQGIDNVNPLKIVRAKTHLKQYLGVVVNEHSNPNTVVFLYRALFVDRNKKLDYDVCREMIT